jgi:hypothetical protein
MPARSQHETKGFVQRTYALKHSTAAASFEGNRGVGHENNHRVGQSAPEPVAKLQQTCARPSHGGWFSLRQISALG